MTFNQLKISGYVLVAHNPAWIETSPCDYMNFQKLLPLLGIYVFENLCTSLTSRSKTAEDYDSIPSGSLVLYGRQALHVRILSRLTPQTR